MPDISKLSGIDIDSIAKLSGVTKSSIAKVGGVSKSSSPAADIVFSDVTFSSFDTRVSSSSPFNATLPSTASSGDFVMVLYANDLFISGNYTVTPTGWTLRQHLGTSSSDNHLHVFTRVFDGSEGSTVPFAFNLGGFSINMGGAAWSMICENIDTTDPVGTNTTQIDTGGTGMTIPTATTSSAGTFIAFVGFDGSDGDPVTFSNNGGFTLTSGGAADVPAGGNSGSHLTTAWQYANIGASTSTGTTDVTFQKSDGKSGIHLVLQRA